MEAMVLATVGTRLGLGLMEAVAAMPELPRVPRAGHGVTPQNLRAVVESSVPVGDGAE